jgi:hypothetical protein
MPMPAPLAVHPTRGRVARAGVWPISKAERANIPDKPKEPAPRRRQDDFKNEVVCKHCTRFGPRHGKTLPGKNEPYRVWQTHAPDYDRDDNSYSEEANGVSECSVHCSD